MSDRRLFVKGALMLSGALFGLEGKGLSLMERGSAAASAEKAGALPGEYFRRLAKWCAVVQEGLRDQPGPGVRGNAFLPTSPALHRALR